MRILILLYVIFTISIMQVDAYKVYSYDKNGIRVYRTVEQKDFAKNKNRPKRSYVRTPRLNWEITDEMRSRRRTFAQVTNRKQ